MSCGFLIFNENIRDQLLSCDLEQITANTRKLLHQYGQSMLVTATKKYEAGLISERTYKLIQAADQFADKDAGLA